MANIQGKYKKLFKPLTDLLARCKNLKYRFENPFTLVGRNWKAKNSTIPIVVFFGGRDGWHGQERIAENFPQYRCAFEDNRKLLQPRQKYFVWRRRVRDIFLFGSWDRVEEVKRLFGESIKIHRLMPAAVFPDDPHTKNWTTVPRYVHTIKCGVQVIHVSQVGDNWTEPQGRYAPIKLFFGVPYSSQAKVTNSNRSARTAFWPDEGVSVALLKQWERDFPEYEVYYWPKFNHSAIDKYFDTKNIITGEVDPEIALNLMCANISCEIDQSGLIAKGNCSISSRLSVIVTNMGAFSSTVLLNALPGMRVFVPYVHTEFEDLLTLPNMQFASVDVTELAEFRNIVGRHGTLPLPLKLLNLPLDLMGWRKNYMVPLFAKASLSEDGKVVQVGHDIPGILENAAAPFDSVLLERAKKYRELYVRMRRNIVKQDFLWDPNRPEPPSDRVDLIIWDDGDSSHPGRDGSSVKTLVDLAKSKNAFPTDKEVWCLRLRNGVAVPPVGDEISVFPNSRKFVTHIKDVDRILENAESVYIDDSILGFEALILGKHVVVYGEPFYAGWGLTEDRKTVRRRRTATLDELTAAAFFIDKKYLAPFSGESISAEDALVLLHMRERPDMSYVIEYLFNGQMGQDFRYPVLETRFKVYSANMSLEAWVMEHLRSSLFGRVMNDLLSGTQTSENIPEFVKRSDNGLALRLLTTAISAYCLTVQFDALVPLFRTYISWFESKKRTLDHKQITRYFDLYLTAATQSKFSMAALSTPPDPGFFFGDELEKEQISALIHYMGLLIRGCYYDRLEEHLPQVLSSAYEYHLKFLAMSKVHPWRHERDYDRRQKFAHKVAQQYVLNLFSSLPESKVVNEFKVDISGMLECFIDEDIDGLEPIIKAFGKRVSACKNNHLLKFVPAVRIILDWMIVSRLYRLARLLVAIINPVLSPKMRAVFAINTTVLSSPGPFTKNDRNAVMRNVHQHFSNTTLHQRVLAHFGFIEEASKICRKLAASQTDLINKMNLSRMERLHSFNVELSIIACRVPQPENPKGYIFPLYYNHIVSALYPLVICELAKKGYACVNLQQYRYTLLPSGNDAFNDLSGILNLEKGDGEIKLDWDVDMPQRILKLWGYDFYWGMFEGLSMDLRRILFDYAEPVVKKYFLKNLRWMDYMVRACRQVEKRLESINGKGVFLLAVPYAVPQSAITDYITNKQHSSIRAIFFRSEGPRWSPENQEAYVSTLNFHAYPFCRFPSLARPDQFEDWFQSNRDNPDFKKKIVDIRDTFGNFTMPNGSKFERIIKAKQSGKKIVCCYSRLVLDRALRHEGGPGHVDMMDWIRHTLEIADSNKNIFLLLKPHPHELTPEYAVDPIDTLKTLLPEKLPDNAMYLEPDDFSTPQLYGMIDLAALWLGTAVMELMVMGIPVVVASHAGQHEIPLEFLRPRSRVEYERMITACEHSKASEESIVRAAALYCYLGTDNVRIPYKYGFTSFLNYFASAFPYFVPEQIESYFKDGDPYITRLADEIIMALPKDS